MATVIDRNIGALLERRQREEANRSREEHVAQRISDFAGRMSFVYAHAAVVLLWVAVNLGWLPRIPRFDPTFVVLATVASVEAIFLGTFILITQNRMSAAQAERADLDLHISLVAEHELTRLATLVVGVAQKLGVDPQVVAAVAEVERDIHPEQVLERMDAEPSRD